MTRVVEQQIEANSRENQFQSLYNEILFRELPVATFQETIESAGPKASVEQALAIYGPKWQQDPADLLNGLEHDRPLLKATVFARLTEGLSRSTKQMTEQVVSAVAKKPLDQAALDELEEMLIEADLGHDLAAKITAEFARNRFGKQVSEVLEGQVRFPLVILATVGIVGLAPRVRAKSPELDEAVSVA